MEVVLKLMALNLFSCHQKIPVLTATRYHGTFLWSVSIFGSHQFCQLSYLDMSIDLSLSRVERWGKSIGYAIAAFHRVARSRHVRLYLCMCLRGLRILLGKSSHCLAYQLLHVFFFSSSWYLQTADSQMLTLRQTIELVRRAVSGALTGVWCLLAWSTSSIT